MVFSRSDLMTDSENIQKGEMPHLDGGQQRDRNRQILLWIIFCAIAIFLLIFHFGFVCLKNVLIALSGVGLMIVVHEFGHFITAKLMDMNVTAFSIGFPPTLIGIKRTEKGCRLRVLPALFKKEDSQSADEDLSDGGRLTFYLGRGNKHGDTEYRIGLIPIFGGYVKVVGQEDVGIAKTSDDPRSYVNKPVWQRFAFVVMGVVFNAILAVAMFMVIFGIGKELPPPIVGGIAPDSPAARAGLAVDDEIIEIGGKSSYLDFSDIAMAAVLSGRSQKVAMKVRHEDGSIGRYELAAEKLENGIRQFGIMPPVSLNIMKNLAKEDADELFEQTGFKPGDKVVAVNGIEVQSYWQLQQIVSNIFGPTITLKVERAGESNGKTGQVIELVEGTARLGINSSSKKPASKFDFVNIYTMVPRLKVVEVLDNGDLLKHRGWLEKGDVIVKIEDIVDPNLRQFRQITEKFRDKSMPVEVVRTDANGVEKIVQLSVIPRYDEALKKVVLGILIEPDFDRAIVGDTVDIVDGPKGLVIPKGAVITAVDGQKVSNFYDVMRIAVQNVGKDVKFDWAKDTAESGSAVLSAQDWKALRPVRSSISNIPFEPLVRLYKAKNIIETVQMGYKKTWTFIVQSYLSIRRLVEGLVGPKELMGPVGIAAISYQIVSSYSILDFVYLLALLNVFVAALNILPMLPFDGGHALFLLIEKIKGSPVSEKIQNAFAMTGWVLVGCLFLYVTFNDILRFF
jgi:regulator of sigma E protease